MAKSKQLSSRSLLFVFAAVLTAVIIGVAATAHAEDNNKRERGERGIRASVSLKALHGENKTNSADNSKPNHQKVVGTVSSVSVTGNTLVVVKGNSTTTVAVNGSTKILGAKGSTLTLADITTGSRIKAVGSVASSTNVFTATKVTVKGGLSNDAALKVIARLEALIEKLKLRFGL